MTNGPGWLARAYGLAEYGCGDCEREYQARLVMHFSVTAALVALFFAVHYYASFHFAPAAVVLFLVAIGYGLVPLTLRFTTTAVPAGHVIAALLLLVISYLGSLRPTFPVSALMYTAAVPVVLTPLSGHRAAAAWLVVGAAMTLGFAIAVKIGITRPAFEADPSSILQADATGVTGLMIVVWAITLATDRARRRIDSERRHLADQLHKRLGELVDRRTAELQRANRELETFAYSIAHDLRAPLRALDGFSALLLEDCGKDLDAAGREHVRRIRWGSRRLAQMLEALLGLARVARGTVDLEDLDITATALEIGRELRARVNEREIEFVVAPHLRARADPGLLQLIIGNLLENAIKFTRGKSPARIELGLAAGDANEQTYFVSDNGVGFDAAHVGMLFEPFSRLHREEEFPGTGIGLATVRRAVERLGGRAWAHGSLGGGATFYFTLPAGAHTVEPVPSANGTA